MSIFVESKLGLCHTRLDGIPFRPCLDALDGLEGLRFFVGAGYALYLDAAVQRDLVGYAAGLLRVTARGCGGGSCRVKASQGFRATPGLSR